MKQKLENNVKMTMNKEYDLMDSNNAGPDG